MNTKTLTGKVALVTGGSRSMGAAIVRRLSGEFAGSLKSLMALKRYGTGDEIASFVSYLASPEAGYITGASLTIDGGFAA